MAEEEEKKSLLDKAAAAEKTAAETAAAERAEAIRASNVKRAEAARIQGERRAAERLAAQKAAGPKKGTVTVRSLRIRSDHTTQSSLVGGLVAGNEVTIYETWTDGKDTWARVGDGQWAAIVYDGETFIKLNE